MELFTDWNWVSFFLALMVGILFNSWWKHNHQRFKKCKICVKSIGVFNSDEFTYISNPSKGIHHLFHTSCWLKCKNKKYFVDLNDFDDEEEKRFFD